MTQEDRQLLLTDLCARWPYGVEAMLLDGSCGMVHGIDMLPSGTWVKIYINRDNYEEELLENVKPYLRPLSSMTEDEKAEMHAILSPEGIAEYENYGFSTPVSHFGDFIPYEYIYEYMFSVVSWLNEHHFDYNELITKGLALEAPEGMYKIE